MSERPNPRRTRVKTGCLTCRARRKNCDEQKPVCAGCKRNKITCSWVWDGQPRMSNLGIRLQARITEETGIPLKPSNGRPDRSIRRSTPSDNEQSASGSSGDNQYKSAKAKAIGSLPFPLALEPRFQELFSTGSLKHPNSRILFEHYINETANLLSAMRGQKNPFITCVLPFAHTDSMVMDSVLAISGAHLSCKAPGSDMQLASATHYSLVLRQLQDKLNSLTPRKGKTPANLLLTTLMLSQIESISGNFHVYILQHLRASCQFLRMMPKPKIIGHDLRCFLLEMHAYLSLVVNVTANSEYGFSRDTIDSCMNALGGLHESKSYGAMLGCAHDLFELIPSICKLGETSLQEEREGLYSFETMAMYKSFESKIKNWEEPEHTFGNNSDFLIAAKIYQQALLIFLHTSFWGSNVSDPVLLDMVDHSIEILLSLIVMVPADSPILTALLWPSMIIGSCLRRPEERAFLQSMMASSLFNNASVSRAVQTLEWLWEDGGYGPYGLGAMIKKRNISPLTAYRRKSLFI